MSVAEKKKFINIKCQVCRCCHGSQNDAASRARRSRTSSLWSWNWGYRPRKIVNGEEFLNCSVSDRLWLLFFSIKNKVITFWALDSELKHHLTSNLDFEVRRGFKIKLAGRNSSTLDLYFMFKSCLMFSPIFRQTGALGFFLQPLSIKISNLNWHSTIFSVFRLWNDH